MPPFNCYFETDILEAPRLEPLSAETSEAALEEASALMALRPTALKTHVFEGEQRIGTLLRP